MTSLILASALLCTPVSADELYTEIQLSHVYSGTSAVHEYDAALTDEERQKLWDEWHFCIMKMHRCLDKSEEWANKITDVDLREVTVLAIKGAVGGLAGRSLYAAAIGALLNVLGDIGGEAYKTWRVSRDWVMLAGQWAENADYRQERLWRDE